MAKASRTQIRILKALEELKTEVEALRLDIANLSGNKPKQKKPKPKSQPDGEHIDPIAIKPKV